MSYGYNPGWEFPGRIKLKRKKKNPRKRKVKPARGLKFIDNITENGFITTDTDNLTDKQLKHMITVLTESRKKEHCHQTLTDRISQLFNDEASSDIILKINDDVNFYVHRLIICSWSENIIELFTELDETVFSSTVDNVEAFELFLKYMYTERISTDVDLIWDIVSLADMYKVDELKQACSVSLIEYISTSQMNEKLVEIMRKAQVHNMKSLKGAIWQRILHNLNFFSESLLPSLSARQLCEALKRSDLVAEDEYCLFQKLLPKLRELYKAKENVRLRKILDEVRFTEMSGNQLQRVMQIDIVQPMKLNIKDAILHRSLLWENQTGISERKGPRLYLNPPAPILERVNDKVNIHELSISKNGENNWKCYQELKVTPESPCDEGRKLPNVSFEKERKAKNLYFVNEMISNSCWTCIGPDITEVRLRERGDQLMVTIETKYKKLTKLVQREATVIVVVQDESKVCTECVLSTKVLTKCDPQNYSLHFTKPICFNSSLKIPLQETKYLTLFVFINV